MGLLVYWPVEQLGAAVRTAAESGHHGTFRGPAQQDLEVVPCAICWTRVDVSVRESCSYRCGRVFHTGCYNARVAVYRGDRRYCAICNAMVG